MFGSANVVKYNVREKLVYSGYGIAFGGAGEWSFQNDFARNVLIFCVVNSSSSHTAYCKNDFLVLFGGDTFGINGKFVAPEEKFTIIFTKAKPKFCFSLYHNGDNSYLFVNGKEI